MDLPRILLKMDIEGDHWRKTISIFRPIPGDHIRERGCDLKVTHIILCPNDEAVLEAQVTPIAMDDQRTWGELGWTKA